MGVGFRGNPLLIFGMRKNLKSGIYEETGKGCTDEKERGIGGERRLRDRELLGRRRHRFGAPHPPYLRAVHRYRRSDLRHGGLHQRQPQARYA